VLLAIILIVILVTAILSSIYFMHDKVVYFPKPGHSFGVYAKFYDRQMHIYIYIPTGSLHRMKNFP